MATKTTIDPNLLRMLKTVKAQVDRDWGPAFANLGSRLQRAVLAEAVLVLAFTQDDTLVSDAIVRRIVCEGWRWVLGITEDQRSPPVGPFPRTSATAASATSTDAASLPR